MLILIALAFLFMCSYALLIILKNHSESYSSYEKVLKLAENSCLSISIIITLQLVNNQGYTHIIPTLGHLRTYIEVLLAISLVLAFSFISSRFYFIFNQEQLSFISKGIYYLFRVPEKIFDLACTFIVRKIIKVQKQPITKPTDTDTIVNETPLNVTSFTNHSEQSILQKKQLSDDFFHFFNRSLFHVVPSSKDALKNTESIENCSKVQLNSHKTPVFITQKSSLKDEDEQETITGYIDKISLLNTHSKISVSNINEFIYTPESINLKNALKALKEEHVHLGILTNEIGECNGYFTKKKLSYLLTDHLQKSPSYNYLQFITTGSVFLPATSTIKDINTTYRTQFPSSLAYKTLSGFFMHKLGRIAKKGDSITYNELTLKSVAINGPKIITIKMEISK